MGDFYIRQSTESETRGPFDGDQMVSLAEAGQITLGTEVMGENKNSWVAVRDLPELKALLFPEHKKLGLKKERNREGIKYINKPEDEPEPTITVEQMLAAAGGHTEVTKNLKSHLKNIDRAAGLSMPMLTVMMALSSVANCLPRYRVLLELFTHGNGDGVMQQPLALVGIFDCVLALGLFLNIFSLFPVIRLRAMLGVGFFVFYYWSQSDPISMIVAVTAGLGLFVCTMTLNLKTMIWFALIGVASMGYFVWMAWTTFSAAGG